MMKADPGAEKFDEPIVHPAFSRLPEARDDPLVVGRARPARPGGRMGLDESCKAGRPLRPFPRAHPVEALRHGLRIKGIVIDGVHPKHQEVEEALELAVISKGKRLQKWPQPRGRRQELRGHGDTR